MLSSWEYSVISLASVEHLIRLCFSPLRLAIRLSPKLLNHFGMIFVLTDAFDILACLANLVTNFTLDIGIFLILRDFLLDVLQRL